MRWKVEDLPDRVRLVSLAGHITESADFAAVAALPAADALRIDLSAVETINSSGVRRWVQFVRLMASLGRRVELARCSPVMVRHFSTIMNFRGEASVRSVMLPYCCGECSHEEYVELDLLTARSTSDIAPTTRCTACGGAADFDDLPEPYVLAGDPAPAASFAAREGAG